MDASGYDQFQYRLIDLFEGRPAASFAIGHVVGYLIFLDVAVDDFDAASAELHEAMSERARFMAAYDDLAEAYTALTESGKEDEFRAIAIRFHYRLDCTYAAARRVLDRVVVLANELLPRPHGSTDLRRSHHGFRQRLVTRCAEIDLEVPESLLDQIDDLDRRIRSARDQIEHVTYPKSLRSVRQDGADLVVEWRTLVQTDEAPLTMRFSPRAFYATRFTTT